MSPSSTVSSGSAQSTSSQPTTAKQEALMNPGFCRSQGMRAPTWQVVSDRRGGRTAWSCTVIVAGAHIGARFWYDGQFVNSAKEDAAEVALQRFGQLPTPPGPQVNHLQHQQQRMAFNGAVGT
ncbi:hypothetical protein KC340_g14322 [Hortaea werneckii]|nr:hypothetical protein KC342_g14669 [Hortaea werneckii]KAI7066191.1 hypothetical protein KC339_g15573 [Hortaea werneckii]KAI7216321.1 hypothetical protein KC365_g13312 [Hortaea werneckii]KAI7298469.1 hypothetical protein KC340_g14322 [Hortaea werneckii]KAI7383007.1 hypothetical protein KC328_g11490 [Hortaea werneckii]